MAYYKFNLDKIDKMVIAGLCIIMTFFCVFNTFCYADVDLIPTQLNGLRFSSSTMSFVEDNSFYGIYYNLPDNYSFSVSNDNLGPLYVALLTDSVPTAGSSVSSTFILNAGDSFDFISSSANSILYIYSSISNFEYLNISSRDLGGISGVIDSLVDMLNPTSFWEVFETAIPFVGVVVLASFGFYLIFHNVKEISKGREKMN